MSSIQKEETQKVKVSFLAKKSVTFTDVDELSEIFLEKFIALNPLSSLDEKEEEESNLNTGFASDFSLDI